MIAALAEAGAVLGREDYLDAARGCAEFVLGELRDAERPPAAHLQGRRGPPQRLPRGPRLPARSAADPLRSDLRAALVRARRGTLADTMIARFGDPERGGFFSTSDDHEELIARRKEIGDHPIPSGNSAAALGLLRLAALTGERAYEEQAAGVLRLFARTAPRAPRGLRPPAAGTRLPPRPDQGGGAGRRATSTELAAVVRAEPPPPPRPRRRPRGHATRPSCSADRTAVDGEAAAYVCEQLRLPAPVTDPAASSPPDLEGSILQ